MDPGLVELKVQMPGGKRCDFCNKSTIDTLMWGTMYHYQGITVHYFCMLFSAGLSQNGTDDQGILGFLPKDIKKELNRGKKLKCKYCKGVRATVGCSVKSCKMSFHYSCGLDQGCLYQFIGNYESYCVNHREKPIIKIPKKTWECPICFSDFSNEKFPLKSPCCNNNTAIFHRRCIMESADKSGLHHFKCPLCNNKDHFCNEMRLQGIYVPDRDAKWETEPNAYAELNEHYNKCDKQPCLCPSGPEFRTSDEVADEYGDWKLIRCGGCGASAVHMKCGGLTNLTYRCGMCVTVLKGCNFDDSDDEGLSQRDRIDEPRSQEVRINRRLCRQINYSDSEEDEPVQNFLESLPSSTPSTLVVADDEDSNSFASFRFKSSSEEENIARIPPKQTRSSTSQQNTSVNDTWSKDTDNLSWPEDDEDDDDLTEETEQDFIMSSTKNVPWKVAIDTQEGEKMRIGLANASNNRKDVIDLVTKVKSTNRPSDRTLRRQFNLPKIISVKSVPLIDMEDKLKDQLNQLESKFGVKFRDAWTKISSDEDIEEVPQSSKSSPKTTGKKRIQSAQKSIVPTACEEGFGAATTNLFNKPSTNSNESQYSTKSVSSTSTSQFKNNYNNRDNLQQLSFSPAFLERQKEINAISELASETAKKMETNEQSDLDCVSEIIYLDDTHTAQPNTNNCVPISLSSTQELDDKTDDNQEQSSRMNLFDLESANVKQSPPPLLENSSRVLKLSSPSPTKVPSSSCVINLNNKSSPSHRKKIIQSKIDKWLSPAQDKTKHCKSVPLNDDDDDEVIIITPGENSEPSKYTKKNVCITIEENSDDDIQIELVNLVCEPYISPTKNATNTTTSSVLQNSGSTMESRMSISKSNVCYSAALIANSTGLGRTRRNFITNTNTNSGPDETEVITLDDSDEEDEKIPPPPLKCSPCRSNYDEPKVKAEIDDSSMTSNNKDNESTLGEGDTTPNQDRDLQGCSNSKRDRIDSTNLSPDECEETPDKIEEKDNSDLKRPRLNLE
ncbi:uncharacterized protein LOC110842812 isoform X1 [Folsomia candida]|uniref:uncharacterized protein LOC110842812 isoform X1 n=1 Tax=Folsomia candida TaxID=158441 RepID=UPI000B90896C|nr:uncharacterized protein LOC110842812 isoform X1 [Folsomia candida]